MIDNVFDKRFNFYKKNLLENKEKFGELDFTSATLKKFLPHIKNEDYIDFIALAQTYSYMALYDVRNFKSDKIKVNKTYEKNVINIKRGGNIICTYHCGSYTIIPLYLLINNIPFKMVTDNTFIIEQGKEVQEQVKKYSVEYNTIQKEIEIISAEEKQGIFKCIKSLKQGFNLLIYIDGNRGLTNSLDNKNLSIIKLFDSSFFARIGIAYLAKLTNANIYPIISLRTDKYFSKIKVFKPITPNIRKFKDNIYVEKLIQKLYKILEESIKNNLAQWEGWLYLHLFIKPDLETKGKLLNIFDNDAVYIFNENDYGLMNIQNNYFLFDKNTFITYRISCALYETINYFKNGNKTNCEIQIGQYRILINALNELKSKKILILKH